MTDHFRNIVEERGKFPIPPELQHQMATGSLEECTDLLKKEVAARADGLWVYTGGSHHVAVIRGEATVLKVKDKEYC